MSEVTFDTSKYFMPYMSANINVKIVEFLMAKELYNKESLAKSRVALLEKTNLFDELEKAYADAGLPIPSTFAPKKEEMTAKLSQSNEQNKETLEALRALSQNTEAIFSLATLKSSNGITAVQLNALFEFAKLLYSFGKYEETLEIAQFLVRLESNKLDALWAKLNCNILLEKWSDAEKDLNGIKAFDDSSSCDANVSLSRHVCFLHHLVLVTLRGRNIAALATHFVRDVNSSTVVVQTCPYLLRYIIAAYVMKSLVKKLEDLARLINAQETETDDAFVKFVILLFGECDFVQSNAQINSIYGIAYNDFLLEKLSKELKEKAQRMSTEQIKQLPGVDCREDGFIYSKGMAQSVDVETEKIIRYVESKTKELKQLIDAENM